MLHSVGVSVVQLLTNHILYCTKSAPVSTPESSQSANSTPISTPSSTESAPISTHCSVLVRLCAMLSKKKHAALPLYKLGSEGFVTMVTNDTSGVAMVLKDINKNDILVEMSEPLCDTACSEAKPNNTAQDRYVHVIVELVYEGVLGPARVENWLIFHQNKGKQTNSLVNNVIRSYKAKKDRVLEGLIPTPPGVACFLKQCLVEDFSKIKL